MDASENIKFPVLCHYKIIAKDRPAMLEEIESVFSQVNIVTNVERGNLSEGGHYVTFNASVTIHSLELMRYLDKALRAIDGVKIVL